MYNLAEHIHVFIAYANADEQLKNELVEHLSVLERQGLLQIWYDQKIHPGEDWQVAETEALNQAQIILLLISSDFLASDYAFENQVKAAMQRHEAGTAQVIPIILRDCLWQVSPFGHLQPLPKGGVPVTNTQIWANNDAAFLNIATNIQRLAESYNTEQDKWEQSPTFITDSDATTINNNTSINDTTTTNKTNWQYALIVFSILLLSIVGWQFLPSNNHKPKPPYKDDTLQVDTQKIDVLPTLLDINQLGGRWINEDTSNSFVSEIYFEDNKVKVFSNSNETQLYWGEEDIQVNSNDEFEFYYDNWDIKFVMEVQYEQDSITQLIAIYQTQEADNNSPNIQNANLVRPEYEQLIAAATAPKVKEIDFETPRQAAQMEVVIANSQQVRAAEKLTAYYDLTELKASPLSFINPDSLAASGLKSISEVLIRKYMNDANNFRVEQAPDGIYDSIATDRKKNIKTIVIDKKPEINISPGMYVNTDSSLLKIDSSYLINVKDTVE